MQNNRHINGGKINIAGALSRIGTTTQCIQLIKFLQRSGFTAAYVECNYQNYISAVHDLCLSYMPYEPGSKIQCCDVDMYPQKYLSYFEDGNCKYDYLICDYGNMQLNDFNKKEFLNCDARIIVGGFEPNERYEFQERLRDKDYRESIFIMSFIDKEIEPTVRDEMGIYQKRTFCAPYTPDPFGTYTMEDNEMYPKLMYWICEDMKKVKKSMFRAVNNE